MKPAESTPAKEWTQERPGWCPHTDCLFRRRVMDSVCGGELPEPTDHDGSLNTHRVCLNGAADDGGVFDLQVNSTDLGWFRWIFDALDGLRTSWLSRRTPPEVAGVREKLERAIRDVCFWRRPNGDITTDAKLVLRTLREALALVKRPDEHCTPPIAKEPEVTGLKAVREKLEEIAALDYTKAAVNLAAYNAVHLAHEAIALMESEQGELVERIAVELYSAWSDGQVNGAGGGLTHEWDEIGDDQTGWLDTARTILGTESENRKDDE